MQLLEYFTIIPDQGEAQLIIQNYQPLHEKTIIDLVQDCFCRYLIEGNGSVIHVFGSKSAISLLSEELEAFQYKREFLENCLGRTAGKDKSNESDTNSE